MRLKYLKLIFTSSFWLTKYYVNLNRKTVFEFSAQRDMFNFVLSDINEAKRKLEYCIDKATVLSFSCDESKATALAKYVDKLAQLHFDLMVREVQHVGSYCAIKKSYLDSLLVVKMAEVVNIIRPKLFKL